MNQDWLDLIQALDRAKARFLVVGAHALAAYGNPRATQDLDLWVEPTNENATKVWRALLEFGAPVADLGLAKADFENPEMIVQLGLSPYRVDLFTSLTGAPDFAIAWDRRVVAEILGVTLPVISRSDFILTKRASGRLQDRADLEALGESDDASSYDG